MLKKKIVLFSLVLLCGGFLVTSCSNQNGNKDKGKVEKSMDDAGSGVHKSFDSAGKAVDKAAQKTGDAVNKAADKTKDAVKKAADTIDSATH